MPDISTEKVCFVIVKAREFDVKVAPEELDDGSNAADDGMQRILEDYADDPTYEELKGFLEAQSDDELRQLVALTWIGRGDYDADDWAAVLDEVAGGRDRYDLGGMAERLQCARDHPRLGERERRAAGADA